MGSASDFEYELLLAHDLKFVKPDDFERLDAQAIEVKRMRAALIVKLKADR